MPAEIPGKKSALKDWLRWQESLHPRKIDLGLERCRAVLGRLDPAAPRWPVITVAGTNGKGSCVALMEQILLRLGLRPGTFTSPHLLRYNERIRIAGAEVSDRQLTDAFVVVNEARREISLTYFEFGALAAIELFNRAEIEIGLLEVGLGGRLDACNVIDADVAVITSLALDHQDWLGESIAEIAREKAGIFRSGRPAICGVSNPPDSLLETAGDISACLQLVDRDFSWTADSSGWQCRGPDWHFKDLPLPVPASDAYLANYSCAVAALQQIGLDPAIDHRQMHDALVHALAGSGLPGRFQVVPGSVEWILDVAHNRAAMDLLASNLGNRPRPESGRSHLILGMLADKDPSAPAALADVIDDWYAVSTEGARGLEAAGLAGKLAGVLGQPVACIAQVSEACEIAAKAARPGDRIVVAGSFSIVGPALAWLQKEIPKSAVESC